VCDIEINTLNLANRERRERDGRTEPIRERGREERQLTKESRSLKGE
jgi:hypothetical protein